jgi:hypothetical protein
MPILFNLKKKIIMKKIALLLVKALLHVLPVMAFVFSACKNGRYKTEFIPPSHTTLLIANDTLDNGLVLPVGTEISLYPDKPTTMHIDLPRPYRFIGITATQVAVDLQNFDITCSGSGASDGCRPYTNPTANGCVITGQCTHCTLVNSTRRLQKDVELSDGAVIDLSSDIHFLCRQAEVSQTPPAYPSLFFDSTVLQSLRSFVLASGTSAAFDGTSRSTDGHLEDGYVYLPLSVYGRSLLVPARQSLLPIVPPLDFTPASQVFSPEQIEADDTVASGYSFCCSIGPDCNPYAYYIPFIGRTYCCPASTSIFCALHTPS